MLYIIITTLSKLLLLNGTLYLLKLPSSVFGCSIKWMSTWMSQKKTLHFKNAFSIYLFQMYIFINRMGGLPFAIGVHYGGHYRRLVV